MSTVIDGFLSASERRSDRAAVEVFRRTGVDSCTYRELRHLAERAARLLARAGCGPRTACAILADNDARWCAACLGVFRIGGVAVPLDTSYTAGQAATILRDAGARVLFTTPTHLPVARDAAAALAPPPLVVLLSGAAAGLVSLDDGDDDAPVPLPPGAVSASDPAVILYTSGTTSDPKGVVLTHGNLLAERDGALQVVDVNERDRVLGVLPLFHALALVANLLLPLTIGACVVFLETLNSAEMMRALRERRITAFCVVPQFFYLLHQRILEGLEARGWLTRAAFRGLGAVNGALRAHAHINAGRLLFRNVHAALGGHMRIMVTGGSRFDPRVGRDLYRMGLDIVQAYGLTECSGAATVTRPGDPHVESVGRPLAGVEVRLADDGRDSRPTDRPDGEILIKGPIVMAGYHNRPDATADALRDGWLHTGDLGYFDSGGRLHISGRKKEMIVLSSGKNIYPEEIEAVYSQSPYVSEICVIGAMRPDDPSSERLHAIVVPNFDLLRERGVVNTREMVRFDIEGLSLQLPHHKRVLSFDIRRDPLPRTTTRKLKRHEVVRAWREQAAAERSRPVHDAEWTEADKEWASGPHASRALDAIRGAAKPGAIVTPDASLELDLGLDSMERVELLARLEQLCGAPVPEEVAQRIYTVRELVDAAATAGNGGPPERDPAIDPWRQILAADPDPAVRSILDPKPFFAPFAFAVMKSVYAIAWLLVGFRVQGREHVPREGTYLLSPNHQGYLDAFLLVASLPYRVFRRLFFVGASEYFATPFMRAVARRINVVPVDPDTNLVRAMQAGAFGLRNGRILVLFPEGERSPDGTPRTFKKGAAILSSQLGVPIVPVAIHGVFGIWPRGSRFRWRTLLPWVSARPVLRFGAPIEPRAAGATAGDSRYSELTDLVRRHVVNMWEELEGGSTQSPQ